MLVMIKSGPDTTDGSSGLALAREAGADIVLLQNGVHFIRQGRLGSFKGNVYVLDDDKRLRGIKDPEMDDRAKIIDYDRLTDLMTGEEKVVGMF